MEILSYMDQLRAASAKFGVELDDAAEAIGIAGTTVWRWNARQAEPKLATARALVAYMRAQPESSARDGGAGEAA